MSSSSGKQPPLVDGAVLFCNKGTISSKLKVEPPNNETSSEKPLAHLMNNVQGLHFGMFGTCRAKGVIKPCAPSVTMAWFKYKEDLPIGEESLPAITMASFMVCNCGGLIVPVTHGQGMAAPEGMVAALLKEIQRRYPELDEKYIREMYGDMTSDQIKMLIGGKENKAYSMDDLIKEIKDNTLTADEVIQKLGLKDMIDLGKIGAMNELLGLKSRSEIESLLGDDLKKKLKLSSDEELTKYLDEKLKQCKNDADTLLGVQHPIPGCNNISRGVDNPETKPLGHKGLDLSSVGHIGLPIRATIGGKVVQAGPNMIHKTDLNSAYGNYVKVEDSTGRTYIFGHMDGEDSGERDDTGKMILSRDSIVVEEGEYVLPGQKIGEVGNTGECYGSYLPYKGAHLHYEAQKPGHREDSSGRLDPLDPKENLLPPKFYS